MDEEGGDRRVGLSKGAIAGVVVGGLVVATIAGVVIYTVAFAKRNAATADDTTGADTASIEMQANPVSSITRV